MEVLNVNFQVGRTGNDPVFGKMEDVITNFTQKGYLTKTIVALTDRETCEWRLGWRAKIEFGPEKMTQFIVSVR